MRVPMCLALLLIGSCGAGNGLGDTSTGTAGPAPTGRPTPRQPPAPEPEPRRPAPPIPELSQPPTQEPTTPFYCVQAEDGLEFCERTLDACDAHATTDVSGPANCVESETAWCVRVPSRGRDVCGTTQAACAVRWFLATQEEGGNPACEQVTALGAKATPQRRESEQ